MPKRRKAAWASGASCDARETDCLRQSHSERGPVRSDQGRTASAKRLGYARARSARIPPCAVIRYRPSQAASRIAPRRLHSRLPGPSGAESSSPFRVRVIRIVTGTDRWDQRRTQRVMPHA